MAGLALLGLLFLLHDACRAACISRRHAICIVLFTGLTALFGQGVWYGYLRQHALQAYYYRDLIAYLLYAMAAAISLSLVKTHILRTLEWLHAVSQRLNTGRLLLVGVALPALISVLILYIPLEGLPHNGDGATYLLQAKSIWNGTPLLETPAHPELFTGSYGIWFLPFKNGYAGKYPWGWPALLGLFNALGAPWLANPVLLSMLVLLTYAVARQRFSPRLSLLASFMVAICPWAWWSGASMISHTASAVWLWLFLYLYLHMSEQRKVWSAAAAGIALGLAILTRPQDALAFSLPVILFSLYRLATDRASRPYILVLAVFVLPGLFLYLWINYRLTGSPLLSTYNRGFGSALSIQAPVSPLAFAAWLHESFASVNRLWYAGAWPAWVAVYTALRWGRSKLFRMALPLFCSLSLFAFYSGFVFAGESWLGPRWLLPVLPGVALAAATGIRGLWQNRHAEDVLEKSQVRTILAWTAVCLVIAVTIAAPSRLFSVLRQPLEYVDGRVHEAVQKKGLVEAIVALPISEYADPEKTERNFLRPRSAMVFMDFPLTENPVIYVRAVEGWAEKSLEMWPGRSVYRVERGDREPVRIVPVTHGSN